MRYDAKVVVDGVLSPNPTSEALGIGDKGLQKCTPQGGRERASGVGAGTPRAEGVREGAGVSAGLAELLDDEGGLFVLGPKYCAKCSLHLH